MLILPSTSCTFVDEDIKLHVSSTVGLSDIKGPQTLKEKNPCSHHVRLSMWITSMCRAVYRVWILAISGRAGMADSECDFIWIITSRLFYSFCQKNLGLRR